MKHKFIPLFLIVLLSLTMSACITKYSPENPVVTLESGASQVFTANSIDNTVTLVWYLDGNKVATGGQYTFTAEQNTTGATVTHTVEVNSEGGCAKYYASIGVPEKYRFVQWQVNVLPESSGPVDNDNDGYNSDVDCNDNDATIHPDAEEICGDGIDQDCNGSDLACPITDADQDGYTSDVDCNDNDATIHPGAEDICGDGIDQDCDGVDAACPGGPPATPTGVSASDKASGLTYVQVTWNASDNATYYNVYRAIWEENADYDLVATVTGTSFDFVQDWDTDVYSQIGDTPAMAPDADCTAREDFANALTAYREQATPVLFNFKAPAFFKVEACNDQGCSDMSVSDAGQAEFIHTADFSEVAEMIVPAWGYPQLIALADSPKGSAALGWGGIDICGAGGGMVMGRLSTTGGIEVDVWYENYYEAYGVEHPNALFYAQGWLGGAQNLIQAGLYGVIAVSGEFEVSEGAMNAHIFAYAYIGGTTGNPNYGYLTVTYNGESYQFSLPVQPRDGETLADPPVPVTEDDAANVVQTVAADSLPPYPTPFATAPGGSHCTPPQPVGCDRIADPQPTRPDGVTP